LNYLVNLRYWKANPSTYRSTDNHNVPEILKFIENYQTTINKKGNNMGGEVDEFKGMIIYGHQDNSLEDRDYDQAILDFILDPKYSFVHINDYLKESLDQSSNYNPKTKKRMIPIVRMPLERIIHRGCGVPICAGFYYFFDV